MSYKLPVNYYRIHWSVRKKVREQYIKEQQGLCYWCKSSLKEDPPREIMEKEINMALFPETMFDYPIHLQHDHTTGMTEGAVHARCNAVMWQYHNR